MLPADGPRTSMRVAPGLKPSTHAYIQTGQVDSKFGIPLSQVEQAIQKAPNFVGLHCHLGSQFFEVEIFQAAVEVLAGFEVECKVVNVGGGFGIPYLEHDHPPKIDEYARDDHAPPLREHFGTDTKIMVEPGRWLVGNAGVTAYTVGTVKEIPGVRRYVAVDGGMTDNIRPMLYDAEYTGLIADRAANKPDRDVRVVGMHCESGDVILPEVMLDEPAVGDTLVVPATGGYGHAMASNYNGVRGPPVVFCAERRSTRSRAPRDHDDLSATGRRLSLRSMGDGEQSRSACSVAARSAEHSSNSSIERADAIAALTGKRPRSAACSPRPPVTSTEILEDCDVIVELIGGIDPARDYVTRALQAGKPVISANKALVSTHGQELFAASAEVRRAAASSRPPSPA